MEQHQDSEHSGFLYEHRFGDPANPWIVFFAGWGAEVEDYQSSLERLSEDFHIVAFNLPGFGNHEPLELKDNTVRGHATFFTNALLNDLGLDRPVILMGHSTGAGVAAIVATMLQSLASALILISPIGGPDPVTQSGPRLIKNINWKRARRWLQGRYRRRFLPNVMLGVDAKQLDLTEDLLSLERRGIHMRIFFADADVITPPGALANALDVQHLRWVQGGHSWFKNDAEPIHHELRALFSSDGAESGSELSKWQLFKLMLKDLRIRVEQTFVPSLPILIDTVRSADQSLKESDHADKE